MKLACLAVLFGAAAMPQSAAPDPCKLLKLDDVASIFGAGYKQVLIRGECTFQRRSDNVRVSMRASRTKPATKEVATERDATEGAKSHPGVCDAAFSRPSGSLLAAKGNWLVFVDTSIGNKSDPAGAAKLAAALCSRL